MLRLHDPRTSRTEPIVPASRGLLRMYTCGQAPSQYTHLGNLRVYLLSDLIRRVVERHGPTVVLGQNITEVGQRGDGSQTTRDYEDAFLADCAALNIRPADYAPRTSESIGRVIGLIEKLIATGHAYIAGPGIAGPASTGPGSTGPGSTGPGTVYFDARSVPGYGEISGNRLDDPQPGQGRGGTTEHGKRSPADWALWRGAVPGHELTWSAPWGAGWPGEHTECSANSLHYLGSVIDIHTGGISLRFPHHEDERAQSDSAAGHEVVRHWVQCEQLLFEGAVMGESDGNVVRVADLAASGLDPLAARLALLEHRYRQQANLTWDMLRAADARLRHWRDWVARWATAPSKPMCAQVTAEIATALDNDLDTPAALGALRRLEQDGEIPPGSKFESFAHADQLLGLDLACDVGRAIA